MCHVCFLHWDVILVKRWMDEFVLFPCYFYGTFRGFKSDMLKTGTGRLCSGNTRAAFCIPIPIIRMLLPSFPTNYHLQEIIWAFFFPLRIKESLEVRTLFNKKNLFVGDGGHNHLY